jgi:hypothetical protein
MARAIAASLNDQRAITINDDTPPPRGLMLSPMLSPTSMHTVQATKQEMFLQRVKKYALKYSTLIIYRGTER